MLSNALKLKALFIIQHVVPPACTRSDVHTTMGGIVRSKVGSNKKTNTMPPRLQQGCMQQRKTHPLPLSAFLVEGMDVGEVLLMGISPSEQKKPRTHLFTQQLCAAA